MEHSCDVGKLKSILSQSEKDPGLFKSIQNANKEQRNRPHAFFTFPGTRGSVISLPPLQKWPIQSGWSFSTWVYLEPKDCAQPYVYNFKTSKNGLGYSAHFTGNCLVVSSVRVKDKAIQHCVAYEFPFHKWIHCAITYHNKWRSPGIKVYVNGQLTANIDMQWQVQTTDLFDRCFIGGSGSVGRGDKTGDINCFCGQMSAVYLFEEGLSATQICALHRLGPSYMGQFKYSNESNVQLPQQICKTLYEEKLASTLFCLYTPAAVDSGTLCIQLAPFKSSTSIAAHNYFISTPHAALQGGTRPDITQPIGHALQSLGCVRSLLPLLDAHAKKGDSVACTSLIGLLCDLLESCPHWFANEMVQNNGFVLIACSLTQNARQLLTENLLDILLNLTGTLLSTASTASDSLLLKHLMDNILFNPSMWVYAETRIQIKLYNYLANELLHGTNHRHSQQLQQIGQGKSIPNQSMASNTAVSVQDPHYQQSSIIAELLFSEIRRVSTVLQSLHSIKYYYWIVEEKGINHKARDHSLRPCKSDLLIIRSHILKFARELISRANVIPLDETQGLLNYISSCTQPDNIVDALDTLSEVLEKLPELMVPALDQKQGIRVLMTLIGSSSELIRIKTIRLLSLFLSQCSYKRKQEMMGPNNLFMLLCDRLRSYKPMSLQTYEALIDLMIEENNPSRQSDDPNRPRDISQKSIVNSTIIKVIASLINEERGKQSRQVSMSTGVGDQIPISSTSDIRHLFINDLWNLIVNSRDNRRIILQMSVWQHWLINLIMSTMNDSPLITEQVLAIFRVLLYHAIRYEYGGWRVWIDTLAIIHAKVSFDEFREQINQVNRPLHDNMGSVDLNSDAHQKRNSYDELDAPNNKSQEDQQQIDKQQDNTDVSPTVLNSPSSANLNQDASPSKQSTIVSSISEHILNESRGIEMDDEVEERKPDEVVQCDDAEVEKSQENTENIEEVTSGVDSMDLAPSRAYRKQNLKDDLGDVKSEASAIVVSTDETGTTIELDRQQSLTSIPLDEPSTEQEQENIAVTNTEEEEPKQQADICEDLTKCGDQENNPQISSSSSSTSLNDDQEQQQVGSTQAANSANEQTNDKAQASPAFRIPEFRWTNILVKLLNDLLFSIECDLYHWRCQATLTSLDAPPFAPKLGFGPNATTTTVASHNTVNANHQTESVQSNVSTNSGSVISHLVKIEATLQREENQIYIINVIHLISQLADNVIIAAGGLLPLLADATGGARNNASATSNQQTGNAISSPSTTITCEGLTLAQANSLLYRLTAMVDMVIFAAPNVNLAELEADKNTTCGGILRQCLRLACTVTVKNCLILRSIFAKQTPGQNNATQTGTPSMSFIEFPKDMFDSYQGCSLLSANGLFQGSALTLDHTDLIADLEYSPHQTPNTSSMPSLLPFQTSPIRDPSKLLQPLDIARIQASIYHTGNAESRQSQFIALSSLYFISVLMVSKYRDIIEPKHGTKPATSTKPNVSADSVSAKEPATDGSSTQSTGDSVANKKESSGPISSVEANLLTFGKMNPNSSGSSATLTATTKPVPEAKTATSSANSTLTNMLTSKLENTLDSVCPLLKSIMCDFCAFLSKTLLGSHGQDLVNKEAERTFRRNNASPVELVMLLCSQEWQNTLQKNAGLAFIELINEGRVLSHGMKDHIVRVAMEAEFILSRLRADDVAKHEHFGLACSETLAARLHEEVLINSLISSAARRDFVLYERFRESFLGEKSTSKHDRNYKLDIWEDDDRRKRRFVFDSWPNWTQLLYSKNLDPSGASTNSLPVTNGQDNASKTSDEDGKQVSEEVINDSIKANDITEPRDGHNHIDLNHDQINELHSATHRDATSTFNGASGEDDDIEDDDIVNEDESDFDENAPPDDDDDAEMHVDDDSADHPNKPRFGGRHKNMVTSQQRQGVLNYNNSLTVSTSARKSAQTNHENQTDVAGPQPVMTNNTTNNNNGSVETKNQHTSDHSHSNHYQPHWDYEDYSSVNDFTGSVIFAAEASLIWSIYSLPGVLQITTHELYFEPSQNIIEMIDMLKRTQDCQDLPGDENDLVSRIPTKNSTKLTQAQQCKSSTSSKSTTHDHDTESTPSDKNRLRKIDLMALRYCDFLVNTNGKIQLADIRAIFSRHYLLQPNGLEIFLAQRSSVMFAFADFDIVKRMVKYLPPVGVGIKYGIAQNRRASLMSARQLFAASNMTQRWQRREIGNFQYLMFLNTIAGRTYQDLNQYPVFPWILTNYESDELDLNLPTNFRDLSKPVGALNAKRRDHFIERYQTWDNPKVPAFHYGTHYSTAAFTLNWLCRLRGHYNSSYLALQDNKYEEQSRLFLSIADSWVSSLVGGQQNVKELIPEFYYLPEMFYDNLGLPKVELPAWCNGSAEQFVRMHRIALESELVSCQLHQWIDLIFGYKQRGPEAINCVNTFYYLTYQGNVNLNMIKDPSLRDAIETQIKHFGQTPSQLSTEPHPPRFSALHAAPMTFASGSSGLVVGGGPTTTDELSRVVKFPFNHSIVHISSCIHNYMAAAAVGGTTPADSPTTGTVQQRQAQQGASGRHASGHSGQPGLSAGGSGGTNQVYLAAPSSVFTITSNNQYQIHKWHSDDQDGHPFAIDPLLEMGSSSSAGSGANTRRQLIDVDDLCSSISLKLKNSPMTNENNNSNNINDDSTADEIKWPCAHYVVTLNGKYIIMGSFYDNSFRVFTTETGKLCQVIYGHRAPITCLARSDGNALADFYLATGSQDCSLLIWFWNERYAQIEGSGVSAVHNPLPKLTISGHETPVLSALISAELGLIISGSKNLIMVHTTTTGERLIQIDVRLSSLTDLSNNETRLDSMMAKSTNSHSRHQQEQVSANQENNKNNDASIQRPQVEDKQKTILEASMLGDPKDQQRIMSKRDQSESLCSQTSTTTNSSVSLKDERITQLRQLCTSGDYYVTSLQLARELAFIVCVALPVPQRKLRPGAGASATVAATRPTGGESESTRSPSSLAPALLLTFNLKGQLMDSAPIGLATVNSSPKLGDTCAMTITRDGEHLILNDSSTTIKIYKTFGLQPVYAFNTNDIYPNLQQTPAGGAASSTGTGPASLVGLGESNGEKNNRIKSLALLDHRYILVGLENGKLLIYNCDFKNLQ